MVPPWFVHPENSSNRNGNASLQNTVIFFTIPVQWVVRTILRAVDSPIKHGRGTGGTKIFGETITFETPGRGLHEITEPIAEAVERADVETGLCSIFLRHTSASLLITENADLSVRNDLQNWMEKIAPEGDSAYTHTAEGPDDMPSHLRAAVTRTCENIPVTDGSIDLGQWQGIYIFEHRARAHRRTVSVRVWE